MIYLIIITFNYLFREVLGKYENNAVQNKVNSSKMIENILGGYLKY